MEHVKVLDQVAEESRFRIDRRINMLGQHLTNLGFEGVEVSVSIVIKVKEPNGSGTTIKNYDSKFTNYTEGFGPVDILGNGALQVDGSGRIDKNDPNAPGAQSADPNASMVGLTNAANLPAPQAHSASASPIAPSVGRRSAWGVNTPPRR